MNKLPWFKFYPSDWIKGTLYLSPQERSAWINLLAHMWESDPQGQVTGSWQEIARMICVDYLDSFPIIKELARKKMLDLEECPDFVRVMSRRMSAECHAREDARKRAEKHRESERLRKKRFRHTKVTDKKSEVRSHTEKNILTKTTKARFEKPTALEVELYAKTQGFFLNGQTFIDHYEAKGWVIGRSPMKSWQAAVRTWKLKSQQNGFSAPPVPLDPAKLAKRKQELDALAEKEWLRTHPQENEKLLDL